MREYTAEEILYKAGAYCSAAEHCESEVRLKLSQWGYTETAAQDMVIDYLRHEHFIDDERYCRAFVHDKVRYQAWGREKIRMMLQAKRLPRQAIQDALDTIDETEYNRVLLHLLQKKQRLLQRDEPEMQRQKLLRYAASHGFSFDEIICQLGQM